LHFIKNFCSSPIPKLFLGKKNSLDASITDHCFKVMSREIDFPESDADNQVFLKG
jgi:hypothetical protein